jgi:peptidoglycan hydrolase CwlO-like protein
VETKQMERDLIVTQIENLKLHEAKMEKTKAAIEEERQRLAKQIQTLKGLSQALETQIKNS